MEEEGIAETWADFLCDECFKAIKYYKGELPENTFIEIRERDFNKNEILELSLIHISRYAISPEGAIALRSLSKQLYTEANSILEASSVLDSVVSL